MFEGTELFDQDLSAWNVSSVVDMKNLFALTLSYDQPNTWDTHRVLTMKDMYCFAEAFNSSLGSMSLAPDVRNMFKVRR